MNAPRSGPFHRRTQTVGHPILEGLSHHSLLMELLEGYRRIRDGREPEPLEPVEVRYADFIAAELESLDSDEDRSYWSGIVEGHARFDSGRVGRGRHARGALRRPGVLRGPRGRTRLRGGAVDGRRPASNRRYPPGERAPALLDLLNGTTAVESPPVRAERPPGDEFRRANVNFSVIQQILTDVTREPFAELMRSLVLGSLGMGSSTFDQEFPAASAVPVAWGHGPGGRLIAGGWGMRTELAAAGLWTTVADLARVLGEVRRAYHGDAPRVLGQAMAEQMLTAHSAGFYGLGSVVDDIGTDIEYGHGGEPAGYRHMLIGRVREGTGCVVLTNAESGREVIRFLATSGQDDRGLGRGRLEAQWEA